MDNLWHVFPFSWHRHRDLNALPRSEKPSIPQSPDVDVNADLHTSDVSSSSSDENPENPDVSQPSRPIVVDLESNLAELAVSESDHDRLLDSQGLIVDSPSPLDHSMTRDEPEVQDQPTAESSTSNLSVPELSISENSSACLFHPGAEGTPPAPCFCKCK